MDVQYTVIVHNEDGSLWAEVREVPGCFASGRDLEELTEALQEALSMCLGVEFGPVELGDAVAEERPLTPA